MKLWIKIIVYALFMPWRLMPTNFRCECGKPLSFKQPVCGWCNLVIEWAKQKEYAHF